MTGLSTIAPGSLRPLSRAEYDRMVDMGLFVDERVELLYGGIVRMTPIGAPHNAALQRLTRLLVLAVRERAWVRIQSSFAASDGSEPEPDVAIVPPGEYDAEHPTQAWLIIEVADTSLELDRTVKARLYAECGVPEYWVVNLVDGLIEVHTEVVRGTYARTTPYRKGTSIQLQRLPDVEVRVEDVLR